jgi:hypothetical protein
MAYILLYGFSIMNEQMTKRKKNIVYIAIIHAKGTPFGTGEPTVGTFTKINQLAKFFGVHYNTAYKWIKTKDYDHGDKSIIVTSLNEEGIRMEDKECV